MKKIYALMATALMSVSMFAALEPIPTETDLAGAFDTQNNVVLCCYFDEDAPVCGDVVLAGSYNEWNDDPSMCVVFEPVADHEGWYAAEAPYAEGFQAKPLHLYEGTFSGWDFQAGDKNAWIHKGGLTATVSDGYADEANVAFGSAGVYIYEIAYWKKHNNPCQDAAKHNYTIKLYAPTCSLLEEGQAYKPCMVGAAAPEGWTDDPIDNMNEDFDEVGDFYTITVYAAEGKEFKFREAGKMGYDNQLQDKSKGAWKDMENIALPAASGDTTLVYDFSDAAMYRWKLCVDQTPHNVAFTLIAPEAAPVAGIEIMGNFMDGGWENGVVMTLGENNTYTATIENVDASKEFKIREAGNWDNQILYLKEDGEWAQIGDGDNMSFEAMWDDQYAILLDCSDPAMYTWAQYPEGIENIVLTKKAQKVVVDGALYIIRDNKMFNIHGAQLR